MGNLFLILTIITESIAVIFMKLSGGFQHKLYAALAVLFYGLSFVFLTQSLKVLPAGIANAIWAGASAVLVTLLSIFFLKESITALQLVSILLVTAGLVGLNLKT